MVNCFVSETGNLTKIMTENQQLRYVVISTYIVQCSSLSALGGWVGLGGWVEWEGGPAGGQVDWLAGALEIKTDMHAKMYYSYV